MALIDTTAIAESAQSFWSLPAVRQLGFLIGVAVSVAVGVVIVLWSQDPEFTQLYSKMSDTDVVQARTILDSADIAYSINELSGGLSVEKGKAYNARLLLSGQGIPRNEEAGYELLEQKQAITSSKMLEEARHKRALEGELAKTISSLSIVRTARVHLAIPKRSVFIRQRNKVSASVTLQLSRSGKLSSKQIEGIIHLISSSVANLESDRVVLVDQQGNLLSSEISDREMAANNREFDYKHRVEESYRIRIVELLTPIVGRDAVLAEVHAVIDFTRIEQSSENFQDGNTEGRVRSEQLSESERTGSAPFGVPGALSNQPPPAGTTEPSSEPTLNEQPTSKDSSSTRNFELDRIIRHTRFAPGAISKLSVAVVVDDRIVVSPEPPPAQGTAAAEPAVADPAADQSAAATIPLPVATPRSAQELAQFEALIKEVVGYNEERGDTVLVSNVSFLAIDALPPLVELTLADQILTFLMDWGIIKQALAYLVILYLVLGIIRPSMRGLVTYQQLAQPEVAEAEVQFDEDGQPILPSPDEQAEALKALTNESAEPTEMELLDMKMDKQLGVARDMVTEDAKRVARVIKNWIGDEPQ